MKNIRTQILLKFGPTLLVLGLLFLALRIINEEKVLVKGLSGYEEYRKPVPYRLIPKIW